MDDRFEWRRTLSAGLFGLAVLGLFACGRGSDYEGIVARLVDRPDEATRAGSSDESPVVDEVPERLKLPQGVIADEWRYVLTVDGNDPEVKRRRVPHGLRRISKGPVTVPERAFLEFGFGVTPEACPRGKSPAVFRVYATRPSSEDEPEPLFEGNIDPQDGERAGRWADARIDLAALGGEEVVFSFESLLEAGDRVTCLPMWSNPTVYAREARPKRALNFIVISIDTLRAGNLGAYGYAAETSPFLDELARDSSVLFEYALTTSASTPQAHMSMFTGLYPSVHGITTGAENLPGRMITLTEILREAGYETGAVTEDGLVAPHYGFARGMSSFRENKSADLFSPTGQVDHTVEQSLGWLRRNSRKKFFLFVHTYQVHDPYSPPPAYEKHFTPYLHEGRTYAYEELPEHLRLMREYDREIRYTDEQLGLLLEGLRTLELDESTVVFVTSDHGEEFLEHGHYKHGAHLYDHEILRVPLIVWGPGTVRGPRRIETPVSLVDLMPTILDLAGLPQVEDLQGISLAPSLTEDEAPPRRDLFAEAWGGAVGPDFGAIPWKRPALAVRNARYKYIMAAADGPDGPRFELYDLVSDPRERKNIAGREPDPWPEGRRKLLGYRAKSAKIQRALLGGVSMERAKGMIPIDRRREEKLRAMGYIE
jgi:arylsulfatase A-like enzyme